MAQEEKELPGCFKELMALIDAGGAFTCDAEQKRVFLLLPAGFKLDVTAGTAGEVLALTPMVPPGAQRGMRVSVAVVPPETPIGSYEATLGLTRDRAKLEAYGAGRPQESSNGVGAGGGPQLPRSPLDGTPPPRAASPAYTPPPDLRNVVPFVKRDANGDLDLPALATQAFSIIRQQSETAARANEARERRADRAAMLLELDRLLALRAASILPEKLNARVEKLTEALATEPS